MRWLSVYERDGDRWRLVHDHMSVPIPQESGEDAEAAAPVESEEEG